MRSRYGFREAREPCPFLPLDLWRIRVLHIAWRPCEEICWTLGPETYLHGTGYILLPDEFSGAQQICVIRDNINYLGRPDRINVNVRWTKLAPESCWYIGNTWNLEIRAVPKSFPRALQRIKQTRRVFAPCRPRVDCLKIFKSLTSTWDQRHDLRDE